MLSVYSPAVARHSADSVAGGKTAAGPILFYESFLRQLTPMCVSSSAVLAIQRTVEAATASTTSELTLVSTGRKVSYAKWEFVHYYSGTRPLSQSGRPTWTPPADLSQTRTHVIVEVNLAGILAGVMRIEMNSRSIRISGSRDESPEREARTYHLLEIERGEFDRTLELPVPVQPSTAEVNYSDGLLTIKLAKINEAYLHACTIAESTEGFE